MRTRHGIGSTPQDPPTTSMGVMASAFFWGRCFVQRSVKSCKEYLCGDRAIATGGPSVVRPLCNRLIPSKGSSRGVTHPVATFVCAVTQFLSSSDLCQLDRVCHADHRTLDTLWNTCAAKCQGQLPVPLLRLSNSDREDREDREPRDAHAGSDGGLLLTHHPRDTAYLWSVAWKAVKQWIDRALDDGPYGTDNILFLRLHHCRCAWCNGRVFPRYNTIFRVHVQEFRQCMWYGMGCRQAWSEPDDCPYLRDLWIDVYDETKHQCTTALLRVLLLLGPFLASAEVGPIPGARPAFVDLWFNIGVQPRIPLAYNRSFRQFSDSGRRSSHESFIDWVADRSM